MGIQKRQFLCKILAILVKIALDFSAEANFFPEMLINWRNPRVSDLFALEFFRLLWGFRATKKQGHSSQWPAMRQRISCYVAVSMSRENSCSIMVTIPFPKQSNPRWQWPVQTVPYCEGLNAARGPIVGGRACGDNRFHATSGGQPRKLLLLLPRRHWQRTGMVTDTIFSSWLAFLQLTVSLN